MTIPDDPFAIFDRIVSGKSTEPDLETIRQLLTLSDTQSVIQFGKYNVNLSRGQGDIHIGDRIYQGASAEAIRDITQSLLQELQATAQPNVSPLKSVDELVQQVRSRLHDDIQRLHGTMPLWGVDHWVPLGELFVDVNILEELSSSRRSELADLWQDFSQNPSYRSLDRIGLGRERQRVSGLEVLAKPTNLMVVGKPGSGKTTYLQRVVTECNAGNLQAHKIPVLIRLREFVEDGRDIGYSLERYLERCWQLAAAETQLVLNQGRSLVLLDGLDEVTGDDGKTITKQIKRFARAYPQVQMVVTCRTQSQESRFERFDSVEVADFNEPQVRAFAEHWFQTVCADQAAGQAKAQVFLEQLFQEENNPIRELAITPILLSLTCAVFQQKQAFYSKRSRLYEEGLELLLEQWDKSREIERDELYRILSLERKLELLSYLAVKKFEQEQYVLFEQAEIEGYIAEFLGIGLRESRAVLRAIESQHGLLIERSLGIWSFSHLTFQEYLVTHKIVMNCDSDFSILKLAACTHDRRWREVFLMSVTMLDNTNNLLQLMKERIDKLLEGDDRLQEFLMWIMQKAILMKLPYKLAAVRAFYLYSNLVLSLVFSPDIYYWVNLPLIKDLDPQLKGRRQQHKLILDANLIIAYVRAHFGVYWSDYQSLDESYYCPYVGADYLNIVLEENLPAEIDRNSQLESALRELLNKAPLWNGDFETHSQWWKEHHEDWARQLKKIIIEHRNIGNDWQFDDSQNQSLQKYYDANKLLVNCLNSDCVVSEEVRQSIEEELLLPIAEIEKRKREKGE